MSPPTFALLGAAGFVAPRHMQAIHNVGGKLLLACDPHDSVGALDVHQHHNTAFTRDESTFWRGVADLKPDYVTIATPNDLHFRQTLNALAHGCKVICEKPLATRADDVECLATQEGADINVILQLRYDDRWKVLREVFQANPTKKARLSVEYSTPRGKWYHASWKGCAPRSGGLLLNIGVHLFDALTWCFGPPEGAKLKEHWQDMALGVLSFRGGAVQVDWRLSLKPDGGPARRCVEGTVEGLPPVSIDLGAGRTDLHTVSYGEILAGRGWGPKEALPAIQLVERLLGVAE